MRASRLRPIILLVLGGCLPLAAFPAVPQPTPPAAAPPTRFEIKRYAVDGTPQLDKADVDAALSWLPGPRRSLSDLQTAQQALQAAYRRKGLTSVYVLLPEQEVVDGVVRFSVEQGRVGSVTITGNKAFSAANIRRALPALQQGQPLDAAKLSQNIQLANENPARQLEVALGAQRGVGKLDAKVKVTDERPLRVFATMDNSGSDATGRHRAGVAVQHANLFDRDHTASLAYTTSPDAPSGGKVNIYSLGYRIPFYATGDSLEAIYGHSNVGIPSGTPALGGIFGLTGKGNVLSVRWNHYLPQIGEYSSRVAASIDNQNLQQGCGGLSGANTVAGCVSYRTQPVGLAYGGKWTQPGRALSFEATVRANAGGSSRDVLSQAAGRPVPRGFKLFKGEATLAQALPADWLLRLNAQWQLAGTALPASEQFSLAGASDVRGFEERAITTDQGAILKTELYTPTLHLPIPGGLQLLAFYDYARGHDHDVNPLGGRASGFLLSSAGAGLRYQYGKNVFWRADFAKPQRSYTQQRGARVHFSVTVGY